MKQEENTQAEDEVSSQLVEKEKEVHNKFENLAALSISLGMLLALCLGLLLYYQFYEGNGNWRFTLKHKANDTTFMATLVPQLQQLQAMNDILKNLKPDTVKVIETVEVPAPAEIPEEEPVMPASQVDVYTPDPNKKYLVQIGAFKSFDLSKFKPGMEVMEQHKINGLNTVTIGRFSTQKEAELFAKDVTALGIKNPLIAKLENGKPVVITPKAAPAPKKAPAKKKTTTKAPVKKKSTKK